MHNEPGEGRGHGTDGEAPATAAAAALNPRDARWWQRPTLWLLALLSIVYAPMFWGQIIFFRDPAHWNYPARAFVRKALLSGQFPHWNPYAGLGLPVWGNPLYGVFYPPNWLLLLVPEHWVANALTWQSFAHMVWGAFGVMRLARHFGCGRAGMLVGGLAWALCGYNTSMWSAGLLLIAGAWVPWVAVGMVSAAVSLRAGARAAAIAKVAAPVGMAFLAGEPFVAMMAVGFGLCTLGVFVVHAPAARARASATSAAKWSLPLALGLAVGFMIAAIVVLPARAVLSQSPRAHGVTTAEAERYSFHPLRVVELFAPGSMGHPERAYPGGKIVGEAAIDGLPLAIDSYLGASVLCLVLFAFGRGRKSAWLLLALWAAVLLVAFGRHAPVHTLWRAVALPFRYMRYPEKYVVLMMAWAALLAALGVERVATRNAAWKRAVVPPALLLALAALAPLLFAAELATEVRGGAVRGAVMSALVLLCLFLAKRRPSTLSASAAAIVSLDLALCVWGLQPFGPADMSWREPSAARAMKDLAAEPLVPPRLYRSNKVPETVMPLSPPPTSVAEAERRWVQTLTPNTGSVWGVATVPGYDAASANNLELFWATGLEFGGTMLRLLSIEYALLPVRDPRAPDKRGEVYQAVMDPLPGARLYKVIRALPRAYVAGSATVLDDQKTLHFLFTPEVTDGGLALLAEGQNAQPLKAPVRRAGNCSISRYEIARVEATCTADRDGVAVFVEQYDPGWQAAVDGRPVQVLRVNHALRGVMLPAGKHQIHMHYHAPAVLPAAMLSLLGVALLVLAAAKSVVGRRTRLS